MQEGVRIHPPHGRHGAAAALLRSWSDPAKPTAPGPRSALTCLCRTAAPPLSAGALPVPDDAAAAMMRAQSVLHIWPVSRRSGGASSCGRRTHLSSGTWPLSFEPMGGRSRSRARGAREEAAPPRRPPPAALLQGRRLARPARRLYQRRRIPPPPHSLRFVPIHTALLSTVTLQKGVPTLIPQHACIWHHGWRCPGWRARCWLAGWARRRWWGT